MVGLGSLPGSETVYVYVFVSPSFALVAPERTTVGATLAIETDCVSAAPCAPSESVACAETVELAGPSGKLHWKEPLVFVFESEPATFVPLAPQLVETEETVSAPESEIV